MTMTAEQRAQLREVAVRAGGGKWIYIRTLSLSNAYITEDTGATVINCTAGDVPAKCAGFLELANPAVVLALLDELERKHKRIAELEARTVTLIEPPRYDCEGYHIDEAYLTPASDGECYDREEALTAFKSACAAAGINLTVEG